MKNHTSEVRFPRLTKVSLIIYLILTTATLGVAAASLYYSVEAYKSLCDGSSISACIPSIYEMYAVGTAVALIAFIQALVQLGRYERWSIFGTGIVALLWGIVIAVGFIPTSFVRNAQKGEPLADQLQDGKASFSGWFRLAWDDMIALVHNGRPVDAKTITSMGFSILSCLALASAVILTIFAAINRRSTYRPGSRQGTWEQHTYQPYGGHQRNASGAKAPLISYQHYEP